MQEQEREQEQEEQEQASGLVLVPAEAVDGNGHVNNVTYVQEGGSPQGRIQK
jgi:hypothetical protein